jgi:uncharacterized protein (DUF1778 family)
MENQSALTEKVRFDEKTPILASEKDREIFFDALMNPQGPNKKLRDAAERYKLFIRQNK